MLEIETQAFKEAYEKLNPEEKLVIKKQMAKLKRMIKKNSWQQFGDNGARELLVKLAWFMMETGRWKK